ncbi:hypothetical protein [Pseudomonas sp.]|uniref:hypothetical protein n=1 Tax=Pseudomonas sp. TaxID=306 RepID=UPI00261BF4E2|nr:hypothetical protein [Pseudomonas sp.]
MSHLSGKKGFKVKPSRLDKKGKNEKAWMPLAVAGIGALASVSIALANTLFVERSKVDLMVSTQKSTEANEAIRLELQRQAAILDSQRLDFQRQVSLNGSQSDHIRLAAELAKAQSDLIPRVKPECHTQRLPERLLQMTCTYANLGPHRTRIRVRELDLIDPATHRSIDNGIASVDNVIESTLTAGIGDGGTFSIYLTEIGEKYQRPIIRVKYDIDTDPIAVNYFKRMATPYVNPKEVDTWAHQKILLEMVSDS